MKSRVREFNDARNKNLSQIHSVRSNANNQTSFYRNIDTNNHSFTSSFIKKGKPDVCVGCVNKKLINNKKQKEGKQKQQTIQQVKAQVQKLSNHKDPNEQYRQKLKKETNQYNKSLFGVRLASTKSFQKDLDQAYLKSQAQRNKKEQEYQKKRLQQEQAQKLQYKRELLLQYKQAQQNKIKNKQQKIHQQTNSFPFKASNNFQYVKQYQAELKRQINQAKIRKQTERQMQIQYEKRLAQLSQKQFQKYTQFSKKQGSNINPQVFQQLNLIDYSKRFQKVQYIQRKNEERLQQLQRERQIAQAQIQKNVKMKKQYEYELKNQMTQKNSRLLLQKQKDIQLQQIFYKYSEQIAKESKILKPCDQCSNKFQEKCLI